MARCKKCNGSGFQDNPKYWNTKAKYPKSDWYLQYDATINCRKCKGTGYLLEDVKDAIEVLKVWRNSRVNISHEDFKKSIDILDKLFEDDRA
ncbi:MAG: hypothetical protein NXI00_21185 [Cytophagales bacterium]|nr:hypothetical protein [Cytophagales bacterium]